MKLQSALISAAALAAGVMLAPSAQAATQSRTAWIAAGPSCQLSLPTTDTSVRGRATGFRNEGTTNATVICQFNTPDGDLTGAVLYVTPTDGVGRNVSCTAVNGYNLGPALTQIVYSTQTHGSLEVEGITGVFQWSAADFGGVEGDDMPNMGIFTVTCTLPPKTQINMSALSYDEDIGT